MNTGEKNNSHEQTATAKFDLGSVAITAKAITELPHDEIAAAIRRHARGDWGEACEKSHKDNEQALKNGSRLASSYQSSDGKKFWIITEPDRCLTTIHLDQAEPTHHDEIIRSIQRNSPVAESRSIGNAIESVPYEHFPHAKRPKFALGQIVVSRSALQNLEPFEIAYALREHCQASFGVVFGFDYRSCEPVAEKSFRIVSDFCSISGATLWVVTETDRSVTTMFLDSDF